MEVLSQLQQAIQQQQANAQIQQAINQAAQQGGIPPKQFAEITKQQFPTQDTSLIRLLTSIQTQGK